MGRLPCRWDVETFANRGDVTFGTALLAHWDPAYLHLAAAVHVPSAAAIDAAIAGDAGLKMMRPSGAGDAGVESVHCLATAYAFNPCVSRSVGPHHLQTRIARYGHVYVGGAGDMNRRREV